MMKFADSLRLCALSGHPAHACGTSQALCWGFNKSPGTLDDSPFVGGALRVEWGGGGGGEFNENPGQIREGRATNPPVRNNFGSATQLRGVNNEAKEPI